MCCDSWGRKESDVTERLNGTELNDSVLKESDTSPPPFCCQVGGGNRIQREFYSLQFKLHCSTFKAEVAN